MERRNKLVSGLIAGAAVGAVAALLFAPKPGGETRRMVATRAGELREKANGYVGDLREKMRRSENHEEVEEPANGHAAYMTDGNYKDL